MDLREQIIKACINTAVSSDTHTQKKEEQTIIFFNEYNYRYVTGTTTVLSGLSYVFAKNTYRIMTRTRAK